MSEERAKGDGGRTSAWRRLPLRVKGLVVVALPLTALLAASAAFVAVDASNRRTESAVASSVVVQRELAALLQLAVDEETGARGYVITADPAYLTPMRRAEERLPAQLRTVEELVAGNPQQVESLGRVRALIDERVRTSTEMIEHPIGPTGPSERLRSLVDDGKATTDTIRDELAVMENAQEQVVLAQQQAARDNADRSRLVILGSVLIGLSGAFVANALYTGSVSRRVAFVAANAARLERDEPLVPAPPAGDELGDLALALERAAGLLVQRQSELVESKETLQAIVDESPDVITIIETDGRIRSASPATHQLLGYEPVELTGTLVGHYIASEDRELVFGHFARLVSGEDAQLRVRFRARRKDGAWTVVDARAHAMLGDDGRANAVIAILRDATAQLELEESLREASDEALRASQAKSEFLSRMSHELRTPLNSVLGFGQLLTLDPLTSDQRENVDDILRAGRHLLALIDEVLDIARIEAGGMNLSLESVDLAEVIESAVSLVRSQATARRITVVTPDVAPGELYVTADRQRFLQVLINLLSNAVKYNRDGGRITIAVATTGATGETDVDREARVRLSVADTGIGIPAERLEEAFAPFERLGADQTDVEGSGVGLALSRAMAERMGGTLTVESEPGSGSTFHVELPLGVAPADGSADVAADTDADPADAADAADADDADEVDGADGAAVADDATTVASTSSPPATVAVEDRRVRIVHIEDNLANLTVIERMLARRGVFDIIPAVQGAIGLDLAREHRPDVVLLDVHLPDMSGDEVLRRLRADPATADIPVVVLSADATPGQIRRLRGEGADHYLTKPVDMVDLLSVLDEMIASGRPARGQRSELIFREESS